MNKVNPMSDVRLSPMSALLCRLGCGENDLFTVYLFKSALLQVIFYNSAVLYSDFIALAIDLSRLSCS